MASRVPDTGRCHQPILSRSEATPLQPLERHTQTNRPCRERSARWGRIRSDRKPTRTQPLPSTIPWLTRGRLRGAASHAPRGPGTAAAVKIRSDPNRASSSMSRHGTGLPPCSGSIRSRRRSIGDRDQFRVIHPSEGEKFLLDESSGQAHHRRPPCRIPGVRSSEGRVRRLLAAARQTVHRNHL